MTIDDRYIDHRITQGDMITSVSGRQARNHEGRVVPERAPESNSRFSRPADRWLRPGSYGLALIAETGGSYTDFAPYVPSINDHGSVAFQAGLEGGGTGIFTSNGGSAVAAFRTDAGTHRGVCSHPDTDDGGAASCYVELTDRSRVVVIVTNGVATTMALDAGPLGPTMNRDGSLAYRTDGSGKAAIVVIRHGELETIAQVGPRFSGFQGLPVLNDRGQVAFRADLRGGGEGIYLNDGASRHAVVETGEAFAELGRFPVLSDAGAVAFCGRLTDGRSGVFVADQDGIEMAIDSTGPFESFRGVLFAEDERLVFYGTPRGGDLGVYAGPDPGPDRILGVGTALFGSSAQELALNPVSINGLGQLAVRVALRDGRQTIIRADTTAHVSPAP